DLSVLKTVKASDNTVITDGEKVTTLAGIIAVHLPIPANLQGKAGLAVYRMHGGKAEALGKDIGHAKDGEYYTIDPSEEFMTVYVKNFSTYALGYDAFAVTITGGGTGASGTGKYSNGETVTINAGSKSGYSFNGWTVTAGTVVLANPSSASTTFIMPAEAVTVTAGWTSTGGGSTTTTYRNTVNQPENGTVTVTPASPAKGQTVTITTKPDAGYVVNTVTVKDANGKTIAVTEKGENSYTFVQPGSKATVEVTYQKAGTKTFTDVAANDWFYDAVMAATANGWFSGTSDTTFSPYTSTSRGMIATILHRIEGTPKADTASFDDVAADAYYANGIAWAEANSIVRGYGNGSYGPNDSITREQLASILYRYAGFKGY
ncbi:MAG: S-layer homology domain-containing protein, partial [Oscillospiraceae bacterium]